MPAAAAGVKRKAAKRTQGEASSAVRSKSRKSGKGGVQAAASVEPAKAVAMLTRAQLEGAISQLGLERRCHLELLCDSDSNGMQVEASAGASDALLQRQLALDLASLAGDCGAFTSVLQEAPNLVVKIFMRLPTPDRLKVPVAVNCIFLTCMSASSSSGLA
eukprot:SAG31_NODE_6013_length_2214_cov_3.029314_3_plen_161_part_00